MKRKIFDRDIDVSQSAIKAWNWKKLWSVGEKGFWQLFDAVIPVTVTEIEYVLFGPKRKSSLWVFERKENGELIQSISDLEVNEDGRFEVKIPSPDEIDGLEIVNQFVWIDEPVGHGIYPNDIFDDLNQALKGVAPSKKKHLKRRLKWSRRGFTGKYEQKKVYVKKK